MIKINGKELASKIIKDLKHRPAPQKILAAVAVGNNRASDSFLKIKNRVAEELGINFKIYHFFSDFGQKNLEREIEKICLDNEVGGVIIQLPLPSGFDRKEVIANLNSKKDIDNLTGKSTLESPAVLTVKSILDFLNWDFTNKTVAVVGSKGFLVGQPIVKWLKNFKKNLFNFIIKEADIVESKNLKDFLNDVDLVISGVGQKDLIDPRWLKKGAGVIDFGYPADLKTLSIDINHLDFYTPTPGGTGPILVAELFKNFYDML